MELFKNSVSSDATGVGKNNPISLKTNELYNYRVTSFAQLKDISECGYVRPKEGKKIVYWSSGSDKLFYYDKRPVLVVSKDKFSENVPVAIDDLAGVYIYNPEIGYEERIDELREEYYKDKDSQSKMY